MMARWHLIGREATPLIKAVLIGLLGLGAFGAGSFAIVYVALVLPVGYNLTGRGWMLFAALVLAWLCIAAIVECWRSAQITRFTFTVAAIPAVWMAFGTAMNLFQYLSQVVQ